jgi:Prenyltransferase and squalene oxidase repeat
MNTLPDHRSNKWILYWRAAGGGSLTLSILLHVLVISAAWLIINPAYHREPAVDFLPSSRSTGSERASQELAHEANQRQEIRRSEMMRKARITVPIGPVSIPAEEFAIANNANAISETLLRQSMGATPGAMSPLSSQSCSQLPTSSPFGVLPASLHGRCKGVDRLNQLKQNGGSVQCERAVSMSLEWLRSQQNKDGSWGSAHKGAMTSLALLCYLGRCETPESPFYGDHVAAGLLYLMELSKKNPHGIFADNPAAHSAGYEHGMGTYALGEMYCFARLGSKSFPGMKEAFEKGVRVIIDHQLPDGGWGYGDSFCYRDSGSGDLSVTGWQFQALKAAKLSGLKIEGLHGAIENTVKYLGTRQTKDGGFGSANREAGYNQWNLTGVGLLGLQTLGGSSHSAERRKGLDFASTLFEKEPPQWDRNANLYAWYYYSQAFFQAGGKPWAAWNDTALPQILSHQKKDGSWQAETADSNIASSASAGADRELYRTTLCTLMLEVYYRYLKVSSRDDGSIFQR